MEVARREARDTTTAGKPVGDGFSMSSASPIYMGESPQIAGWVPNQNRLSQGPPWDNSVDLLHQMHRLNQPTDNIHIVGQVLECE